MESAAHRADQYYFGIAVAIVVDNEDPLGEGRVRVTYPWLNQSLETEWCRVCQLYAGNGYGSFFVPEKKDEVLVAFVHGDLTEAIVLGGLYNGKDKPASKRKSTLDQKLIRTKGKHELLMDDTSDKKRVQVLSSDGQKVLIDDTGGSIRIDTGKGQSVTLDNKEASITVSNKGGQSVTLDGKGTVTVSGPTTVKLSGSTVQLSASKVEIGSSAVEAALLGTTFMTLFNTHVHMLGQVPTTPPQPTIPPPSVLSSTVTVQK